MFSEGRKASLPRSGCSIGAVFGAVVAGRQDIAKADLAGCSQQSHSTWLSTLHLYSAATLGPSDWPRWSSLLSLNWFSTTQVWQQQPRQQVEPLHHHTPIHTQYTPVPQLRYHTIQKSLLSFCKRFSSFKKIIQTAKLHQRKQALFRASDFLRWWRRLGGDGEPRHTALLTARLLSVKLVKFWREDRGALLEWLPGETVGHRSAGRPTVHF